MDRYFTRRVDVGPTGGARGTRSPMSLRRLKTDQEFACEVRRQNLLDQRWRRWRSMILTGTFSAGVLMGVIPIAKVLDALLKAIDIP